MRIKVYIKKIVWKLYNKLTSHKYGLMTPTSVLSRKTIVYNPKNLFMEEDTNINRGAIIMNGRAKFVMKKWSGAAFGLTVITGNHMSIPGKHHKMITDVEKDELDTLHEYDKDVVVEEDVWIGAKSTLLSGTHLGRCCIVGAGSVVRGVVPPYAIVFGNPAKVVGFRFTPKEMQHHEEELFEKDERIPFEILQKNYEKYYINRIKEIRNNNKL